MPMYHVSPSWWYDDSDVSDGGYSTEDEFSSEIADKPLPKVDLSVENGRREVQRDLRERLWVIEQRVRLMDLRALNDDDLKYLDISVRRLPNLDVDETALCDGDPLFFRPFPAQQNVRAVIDEMRHGGQPEWRGTCKTPWQHRGNQCAELKASWFLYKLKMGLSEELEWQPSAGSRLCRCRREVYLSGQDFHAYGYWRVTRAAAAKPHVMLFVMNDKAPKISTNVLSSELISACAVMQHRLRHGDFVDDYTIPVLICSFHHQETARISQFHWDGSSLVVRQSRLLDLKGEEPTEDAFLLLRWLANTPTGETKYLDITDSRLNPTCAQDLDEKAAMKASDVQV